MIDPRHRQNPNPGRDTGAVPLAPVTLLLGSNSSGKSTLLQSLLLLKQTVASPDRTIHLNLGGDEANDYFHFGGFDAVLARGAAAPWPARRWNWPPWRGAFGPGAPSATMCGTRPRQGM